MKRVGRFLWLIGVKTIWETLMLPFFAVAYLVLAPAVFIHDAWVKSGRE